jgi:deoxycytidine triphosphate deaminase
VGRRVQARDARQREDKGKEMAAIYYVQARRAARPKKMEKQNNYLLKKKKCYLLVEREILLSPSPFTAVMRLRNSSLRAGRGGGRSELQRQLTAAKAAQIATPFQRKV